MGRQVWVQTSMPDGPGALDRLWHLTQDTRAHPRWDLRFSAITPAGTDDGDGDGDGGGRARFTYALAIPHPRLPLLTVRGTGTSTAERRAPDGTGTSTIRFVAGSAPADRLSPLADGAGFWRYGRTAGAADGDRDGDRAARLTFTTGYDYSPGWGRLGAAIDPWLTRPLVGWATAWSFDRLRLWVEHGQTPERSRTLALAWAAARVAAVLAVWAPRRRPLPATAIGVAAIAAAVLVATPPAVPSARRCSRSPSPRGGTR